MILPYEKFLSKGSEFLTEEELLAIILRTGTKDKSALVLAKEILQLAEQKRGGLLGLYDIPLKELQQIKGIGVVKAVKLKCIGELAMRINQSYAKETLIINNPSTIATYFMEKLRHKKTECVYLVCLDSKGGIISETKLSDGSVRMSLISPREIYLEALRKEAVNVILLHNHPSGDPTPSLSDKTFTQNVKTIGDMLDIPLLDHIIIGDKRYISFQEEALL